MCTCFQRSLCWIKCLERSSSPPRSWLPRAPWQKTGPNKQIRLCGDGAPPPPAARPCSPFGESPPPSAARPARCLREIRRHSRPPQALDRLWHTWARQPLQAHLQRLMYLWACWWHMRGWGGAQPKCLLQDSALLCLLQDSALLCLLQDSALLCLLQDSALLCLLLDSALLCQLQDIALLWPLLASSLLLLRWSRPALRRSRWSRPAPRCQSTPESLRCQSAPESLRVK